MSSVAEFLIDRLNSSGVKHVFGVPGVELQDFYSILFNEEEIELINITNENNAGFAADAYARVNGIGAACVTYNGVLKIANACACAYAERSPLIVISLTPNIKENNSYLKTLFENITCAAITLDNPVSAGYEIDKAFEALKHNKQPIYIELPKDVATKSIEYNVYKFGTPEAPITDSYNLDEVLEEVSTWLDNSKQPVILAGVEIARYGLDEQLIKFAEKKSIPIVTTLLSKSVIDETHYLFGGIYQGEASKPETKFLVDESDCLLMFGIDLNLAFKPDKFKKRNFMCCQVHGLQVKSHIYKGVQFADFCNALFKKEVKKHHDVSIRKRELEKFVLNPKTKITINRLFHKINSILTDEHAIVADIGESLMLAGDLTIRDSHLFISPALYLAPGFAIPGALGVQVAKPHIRPMIIVGDGAFQTSCSELGTIITRNLNPIIFVLNNDGITSNRHRKDGKFNDIHKWNYHKIDQLFNGGEGMEVHTEEDLDAACKNALKSKSVYIINIMLDRFDMSDGMRRMIASL